MHDFEFSKKGQNHCTLMDKDIDIAMVMDMDIGMDMA
jgi:hypothetical protein